MPWVLLLDDVLAPHILDWIYIGGFDEDEVTIPDKAPETIHNGMAVLESAGKCDSACKNNGRVLTIM